MGNWIASRQIVGGIWRLLLGNQVWERVAHYTGEWMLKNSPGAFSGCTRCARCRHFAEPAAPDAPSLGVCVGVPGLPVVAGTFSNSAFAGAKLACAING